MSKWKCGICNSEFDNYQAQGFNGIIYCPLCYFKELYKREKQENERLKETNVYCNRTDCVGRIRDSRKYDSVYQEKEDYKSRCEKAIEYIKKNRKYVSTQMAEDTRVPVGSFMWNIDDLLNILQNGSENNENGRV